VFDAVFKYADNTNLLIPENIDVPLAVEFSHIRTWADSNGLIINVSKMKELVLHHAHPSKHNLPQSIKGVEQVQIARVLGIIFQSSFSFVNPVDVSLKYVVNGYFLLKQLRDNGIPLVQLHSIFQSPILHRLSYAMPAWDHS